MLIAYHDAKRLSAQLTLTLRGELGYVPQIGFFKTEWGQIQNANITVRLQRHCSETNGLGVIGQFKY